jgi:hypothetical protein
MRLLLLAALLAGCGYHLAGTSPVIPATAHTVAIRLFANHTTTYGLEVYVRRAIEDEFRRRGTFTVVAENASPDLVLSGTIRSLSSVPLAFSSNAEALQYQGRIRVGLRLVERATGRVLYENRTLDEVQDFGVVGGAVITSSPTFQRGTINARDLAAQTNVQLSESRRTAALDTLLDQLAQDVYSNAMEGF